MQERTRRQLHALSLAFYEAQAQAFDASRIDLPWPGWTRLVEALENATDQPPPRHRVLDIGCGNGRFARFLRSAGLAFDYLGTDANQDLLAAARERVGPELEGRGQWDFVAHDFLSTERAGADLPRPEPRPDLIVLMGVLHHVPSRETRLDLLRAAAARLEDGGFLALTAWQFAGRERFERRRVAWATAPEVLGARIDLADLEDGDHLLRFGDDPSAPPRYCHQLSQREFESWPEALGLEPVADFRADGSAGDLNRYWLLRRP